VLNNSAWQVGRWVHEASALGSVARSFLVICWVLLPRDKLKVEKEHATGVKERVISSRRPRAANPPCIEREVRSLGLGLYLLGYASALPCSRNEISKRKISQQQRSFVPVAGGRRATRGGTATAADIHSRPPTPRRSGRPARSSAAVPTHPPTLALATRRGRPRVGGGGGREIGGKLRVRDGLFLPLLPVRVWCGTRPAWLPAGILLSRLIDRRRSRTAGAPTGLFNVRGCRWLSLPQQCC
jgi:hypothetical protein